MESATLNEVSTLPRVAQGVVRAIGRGEITLALGECEAKAQLALAYPYSPAIGDLVLTLCQGENCYIVGVLSGTGCTVLETPGNLSIRAGGRISIESKDLALRASRVSLTADKFESTVHTVIERCFSAYRWVKGALHTVARRSRTRVSEDAVLVAGRVRTVAKDDVVINGKQVKLG